MRILLVQGPAESRDVLEALLKTAGHEVTVSVDNEEISLFGLHSDVILINSVEGEGNGADLVQNLRRQGLRTPIMVVTNTDTWSAKVQAFDCGADDYVSNPISGEVLLGRITLLAKRAA